MTRLTSYQFLEKTSEGFAKGSNAVMEGIKVSELSSKVSFTSQLTTH